MQVASVDLFVKFSVESSHWHIHTCPLKSVSDLLDWCLGAFLHYGMNSSYQLSRSYLAYQPFCNYGAHLCCLSS